MIGCHKRKGPKMKGQKTDQKISIKTAAQILGVSTKSVHRYLTKGRLTKVKEGTRTLLLLPEVKALEGDPLFGQGRPSGRSVKGPGIGHSGDTVTLSMERYEEMLLELGELRKQNQFFIEFKGLMLARDELLRRLENHIAQLTERVLALEMKRHRSHPTEAEPLQKSAGEQEQVQTKPKKPWWQV
jgi:hypothetical protein